MLAILRQALEGGVDAVLLRKKTLDSAHLLALAAQLRSLTRAYQARLLIHTQADVCRAVDADGVHLAAADMHEIPAVRRYLPAHCAVSVSCHHAEELHQAARLGADFATLSPVFPTSSHPQAPALGVDGFHQLRAASPLPVIALGGITPANRQHLAASPVAVISAIWAAAAPFAVAGELRGHEG